MAGLGGAGSVTENTPSVPAATALVSSAPGPALVIAGDAPLAGALHTSADSGGELGNPPLQLGAHLVRDFLTIDEIAGHPTGSGRPHAASGL